MGIYKRCRYHISLQLGKVEFVRLNMCNFNKVGQEFIIWGIGNRGKYIYEFLKGQNIKAFIDSNPRLIGKNVYDLPVISFKEYLNMKSRPIIIISPKDSDDILKMMKENNVEKYLLLADIVYI